MPKLAFLSTAHIHTKSFLEALAQGTDGRAAYAIWDDDAGRGRRYAEQFKVAFTPDLAALLHDPTVDGFIICAENTRHLPLLKLALPAGKPVFCEKPLVTTVAELREVRALLRQYPTTLFCGYFQPFDGAMQAVAALLARGELGRVTRIRYRNAHHAAYGRWFDHPDLHWFYQPALSGGGAFMDMGTHALHLVRTLFGPVTEVWATIGNHSGIYPTCDDFGVAQLRFASGVLGTVEAAWTQTGGLGGLEVVGAKQTLYHNGKDYVYGGPGIDLATLAPAAAKPTRVDRLVDVIRGKIPAAELQADLAAIIDTVAIMEACYTSAKTGAWTPVPSV